MKKIMQSEEFGTIVAIVVAVILFGGALLFLLLTHPHK